MLLVWGNVIEMAGKSVCVIEGCGRSVTGHGYCSLHYQRWKNNGDPLKTQHRGICSVEGCNGKHKARGYCLKHYTRWQSHGDPNIVLAVIPTRATEVECFWERVDRSSGLGPDGDCWEWRAGLTDSGYGQLNFDGRKALAHRVSWFLEHGATPVLDVLHSCDNRPCCNPRHLREGTKLDNAGDMVIRGRSLRGERNPRAKLTVGQVHSIRELASEGVVHREIAEAFDVSGATVSLIVSRRLWAHVE